MTHESLELDTSLSQDSVIKLFRASIADSSVNAKFGRISIDEDRAHQVDEVAAYATGKTLTSQWCVQIYVRDAGTTRHVEMAILGSSILGKVWQGTTRSYSLSHGRLKAVQVINALKEAEASR